MPELEVFFAWRKSLRRILPRSSAVSFTRKSAVQMEAVFANVDTEKRHRIHERSCAENEKSPASANLQGFSVRLTLSLDPTTNSDRVFKEHYQKRCWVSRLHQVNSTRSIEPLAARPTRSCKLLRSA